MNEEIEYNVDGHKPKRTWLWILIVIVVLAAAGAGTYIYLKSDKKAANKNKTQEEAKEKEKETEQNEENTEQIDPLELEKFALSLTRNTIYEGYENPFVLANQDLSKLSDTELVKRSLYYLAKEDLVIEGEKVSIPEATMTKLINRAFATTKSINYNNLNPVLFGNTELVDYPVLSLKYDAANKSLIHKFEGVGSTYTCLDDYETFSDSSTGDLEKLEVTINVLYLKSDGCNWGEETKYQVYSDNARTKLIGEFVLDADLAKGYDEFRKYQQSVKDKAGKINFTFVKVDDEFKYQSSTITN